MEKGSVRGDVEQTSGARGKIVWVILLVLSTLVIFHFGTVLNNLYKESEDTANKQESNNDHSNPSVTTMAVTRTFLIKQRNLSTKDSIVLGFLNLTGGGVGHCACNMCIRS